MTLAWVVEKSARHSPEDRAGRCDALLASTSKRASHHHQSFLGYMEIDRWLPLGGSCVDILGQQPLSLGDAQRHLDRATEIVPFSVVTSTPMLDLVTCPRRIDYPDFTRQDHVQYR